MLILGQNLTKSRLSLKQNSAFTIVELLIVIIVIGILAAVVIIGYSNISKQAVASTIKADLAQAVKALERYKIYNSDAYPTDQGSAGVKSDSSLTQTYGVSSDTKSYCLAETDGQYYSFFVTNAQPTPTQGYCLDTDGVASTSLLPPNPATATSWTVTQIAGGGSAGGRTAGYADGTGVNALFTNPNSIAVAADGTIYVLDARTLRKINPSTYAVTTIAGSLTASGTAEGGLGTSLITATYGSEQLAVDESNNVYISGISGSCGGGSGFLLEKVDTSNSLSFVHCFRTYDCSLNIQCRYGAYPVGSYVKNGKFYFTYAVSSDYYGFIGTYDLSNNHLTALAGCMPTSYTTGALAWDAGNGPGLTSGCFNNTGASIVINGHGTDARIGGYVPRDSTVDSNGNVYFYQAGYCLVRKVTPGGDVTTYAGIAGNCSSTDGAYGSSTLFQVYGLSVDMFGNIYTVCNSSNTGCINKIRMIKPDQSVKTIATVTQNTNYSLYDVAATPQGTLYLADRTANTIWKVTPNY